MQAVGSLVERLAFDLDRVAEGDRRVFICSGAPHLAVGNEVTPNLAIIYQRTVIADGDVGDANRLRNLRSLALQGQIEYERLCRAHGRHGCHQQAEQESSHGCSEHWECLLRSWIFVYRNCW